MPAAMYRETGGSDVLSVAEVSTPSPGAGEVARAAGVFALEDAAGAHDAVEGGAVGKVVIEMP